MPRFDMDGFLHGSHGSPDFQAEEHQFCDSCIYWNPADGSNNRWGECRKRAPFLFFKDRTTPWPFTRSGDWCGDWRKDPSE